MKKIAIEIKWAVIFMFMTLVWMFMEKIAGLHAENIAKHALYTNFIAIPAIMLYVFALLEKRNRFYGGVMTWKQGFISGLLLSLFVALLSPITQTITSLLISPEYFPNAIAFTVASGYMTQEAAEQYFTLTNYIIQGFIGALVMGLITSAVVALFVKKK
jgi:hypothetical protein